MRPLLTHIPKVSYLYKVLDCIYFKTRRSMNISIFKKWLPSNSICLQYMYKIDVRPKYYTIILWFDQYESVVCKGILFIGQFKTCLSFHTNFSMARRHPYHKLSHNTIHIILSYDPEKNYTRITHHWTGLVLLLFFLPIRMGLMPWLVLQYRKFEKIL